MAEFLKYILEALKLAPRYLAGIVITAGFFLFGSRNILEKIGVYNFTQNYRQWVGVVFVAALALLIIDLFVTFGVHPIKNQMFSAKSKKAITNRLRSLTEEEKKILRPYILEQTRTQNLPINNGVVRGLVLESILYLSSQMGIPGTLTSFPFNIGPIAWEYLNKNKRLLGIPDDVSHGK